MKKMKWISLLLAAGMSLSVLAGCDTGEGRLDDVNGTIEGNYQQVTEEELSTKLEELNVNKALGDPTTEDYAVGVVVKFAHEIELGYDWKNTDYDIDIEGRVNVDGGADMHLYMTHWVEGMPTGLLASFAIEEDLSINKDFITFMNMANGSMEEATQNATINMDLGGYLDSANLYLDMDLAQSGLPADSAEGFQDVSQKIKIPLAYIMENMGGLMSEETGGDEEGFDIIAFAEAYGMEVTADFTKGAKLKLETTEETNEMLAAMIVAMLEDELPAVQAAALSGLTFEGSKITLCLHIDENGQLVELALDVDVYAEAVNAADGERIFLDVAFVLNVAMTDKMPTLPTDFSDYADITEGGDVA